LYALFISNGTEVRSVRHLPAGLHCLAMQMTTLPISPVLQIFQARECKHEVDHEMGGQAAHLLSYLCSTAYS